MRTILTLVALCVVQYLGGIREDNFRSSYFRLLPEHRLVGHVIKTTTADSELSCVHKCLTHDACKSGNFRMSGEKNENCELSSRGLVSQTHDPDLVHEEFVFIYVENESLLSTVTALKERRGLFKLFQTFPTSYGRSVTTFVINDELFLAHANVRNSFGGYNTKLLVYLLQQNNFTLNQTLHALGASNVESFAINGEHFLAVANRYNGSSYHLDSVVYRWEAGQFKEFQRIPTNRASGLHYFTVDERKFLLIGNYGKDMISIYEWKNDSFSTKIQDIEKIYPYRCDTFTIRNITYLAYGTDVSVDATTVMKWSGKQFEPFQDLPSSYVIGRPHSFYAKGNVYLAIPNSYTAGKIDTDSYIYRWDGTTFIHNQSIPTHNARDLTSFTNSEGEVMLVVANRKTAGSAQYNVKSEVYKMVDNKFNLYQQLPTIGSKYVHAFTHKGKQYLAFMNNYDGKSHNLDSAVYIWN